MINKVSILIISLLIGLGGLSCTPRNSPSQRTAQQHDNGLHKGWFKSKRSPALLRSNGPGNHKSGRNKGKHKGK